MTNVFLLLLWARVGYLTAILGNISIVLKISLSWWCAENHCILDNFRKRNLYKCILYWIFIKSYWTMDTRWWNTQLWVTNYKEEEEISEKGNNSANNLLLQKVKIPFFVENHIQFFFVKIESAQHTPKNNIDKTITR